MNQFNHRQKQRLVKFVKQFREFFLASEVFILNKGLPYERLSQRLLLAPSTWNSAFSIGTQNHFSKEEMYPGKNWKLVLRLLKATPVFCEHHQYFSLPADSSTPSTPPTVFLETALNLHWALVAANWWDVAKQTKYPFSRLINENVYNSGSVTKIFS